MSNIIEKYRSDVFSTEKCNTGRQIELDIGKAIPIFCLAFVHCVIECCTDAQLLHGIPFLFDSIIGGPISGPMFLFCMGATVHYSRSFSPREMAMRGFRLLRAGFILNIFRFLIPFLIGWALTGDVEKYIEPLPYYMFGNDVLQFAGLAMFVIALFMRLKFSKKVMFSIALAFSVAGTFLRGTDMGNDVLNIVFGWVIGTVNEADLIISDFPLLNWLFIPVCGYIFGSVLIHVKNKNRFYTSFAPAMLVIAVVVMVIECHYRVGCFGDGQNAYYHLYTYDALWFPLLTIGLLGMWYGVSSFLPETILKFFTYTSRHITKFYCIHWVYVRLITNVLLFVLLGTQVIPLWAVMLLSLCIVLMTYLSLSVYNGFKARRVRETA